MRDNPAGQLAGPSGHQTFRQYGLLLALIAIVVIVALFFLGPIVSQIFQNVGQNLQR